MKTFVQISRNKALVALFGMMCIILLGQKANAQPPDCVSGTRAYALFSDSLGSTLNPIATRPLDSSEIRPVDLLTGNVGALMGNRRWWLRKTISGNDYLGAAAMSVDFVTNRFYLMTQMPASGGQKDIYTVNTVTNTMTRIASTPISGPNNLDDYHFVKLTNNNAGTFIYAIGVARDTSLAANTFNPLVRISTCGLTPTTNCATASITILGYLPTTPLMRKWKLFNGDMSFDAAGNMYYAVSAYDAVGSSHRYTDARLFRINAADIPASAGTGIIPMSLVAEMDGLDSTVLNGMAFSSNGTMYFTTRRFNGVQNLPTTTSTPQFYYSGYPGLTVQMPAFVRPTVGTTSADLASCYFPTAILSKHQIGLVAQSIAGDASLRWDVFDNNEVQYFEVQRSENGEDFETIAKINPKNINSTDEKYSYLDLSGVSSSNRYYRIRKVSVGGTKYYSNVALVSGRKISVVGKIKPNPFVNQLEVAVKLTKANSIDVRVIDQRGVQILKKSFKGITGENRIQLTDLGNLTPGIYFLELNADGEMIREKIIKQ